MKLSATLRFWMANTAGMDCTGKVAADRVVGARLIGGSDARAALVRSSRFNTTARLRPLQLSSVIFPRVMR